MRGPLHDETLVDPGLARLLEAMLDDPRPAYRSGALAAVRGLEDGTLVGALASRDRGRVLARLPSARPAACEGGALFQCVYLRSPPAGEREVRGWIVVADGFAGGALVLVHEISHYRNRYVVFCRSREPAPLVDGAMAHGFYPGAVGWVRAQFLNELAARHTAYLAEEGKDPRGPMPEPGALFACAVKIASYPGVYNDPGVMARLIARGDEGLLRDQVGLWFPGLRGHEFFEPGSPEQAAHSAWLEAEVALAARGRQAPRAPAEGTL